MTDLNFDRWDSLEYEMRQDEIQDAVDILNFISKGLSAGVLVVPDSYHFHSEKMESLDWVRSDDPPKDLTGQVVLLLFFFSKLYSNFFLFLL